MRPAGKLKMGYYPCPTRVVEMVASHILRPGQGNMIALADPCAGEGQAVMQLRDLLGGARQVYSYGVELDRERREHCRSLDWTKFIGGDALIGVDWPKYAYDILWFNPPYDDDKEFKRLENRFFIQLVRNKRIIKPGGLFIGILPRRTLPVIATELLNMLDGAPNEDGKNDPYPAVYVFPDPEYDEFEQVVVLGIVRRRARGMVDGAALDAWVEAAHSDDCPVLDYAYDKEGKSTAKWPGAVNPFWTDKQKPADFMTLIGDPVATAHLAWKSGWMSDVNLRETCFGRRQQKVQTLRKLNKSHLAAAIAAGFFNGEVIDGTPEGFRKEMVKGRTIKQLVTVVNKEPQPDGSFLKVTQEQFLSEVISLDSEGKWRVYRVNTDSAKKDTEAQGVVVENGIEVGDLTEWISKIQPALARTADRLFPPLVPDEVLDGPLYRLDNLGSRTPKGKQKTLIQVFRHQIAHKQPALLVVKQGGGKTYITPAALKPFMEEAWAKGEKFRVIGICDKHMLLKWSRYLEDAIPGIKVLIAESIEDINPAKSRVQATKPQRKGRMSEKTYRRLLRKWSNPHPLDADVFLMAYTDISLAGNKAIAAVPRYLALPDSWGRYKFVRNDKGEVDKRTGQIKPTVVLSCPQCGAILREQNKQGAWVYVTGAALEARYRRCTAPKTKLVHDEKNGTIVRTFDSLDKETGQIVRVVRKYSRVLMLDKRGEQMRCNAPLWQHVGDAPRVATTPTRLTERKLVGGKWQSVAVDDIYRPNNGVRGDSGIGLRSQYDLVEFNGKTKIKRAGPRKIDLATFIQRQLNGYRYQDANGNWQTFHIEVVFIDEAHKTARQEAARGMASANIGALAKRSVAPLTGTLSGGYSSTMFYVLWRYTPEIRKQFAYKDLARWIKLYGQYQYTQKSKDERALDDSPIGRNSRRKGAPPTAKEIPGLSPAAYLLFWKYTLFAELAEIFPNLPPKTDKVKKVDLDNEHVTIWKVPVIDWTTGQPKYDDFGNAMFEEKPFTQAEAYEHIRSRLEFEAKILLARGDKGLLAAMLQTLLTFQNDPTEPIEVRHPRTKALVCEFPGLRGDVLYPKEREVLEQIVKDVKNGRKSIVFVTHTGKHDVQARMEWVLAQSERLYGRKLVVASLRSRDVDAIDREAWLEDQTTGADGQPPCDVLICNPKLVETGLDLVYFSDTHFMEPEYSIYTTAQASARTQRPGQKHNVFIYHWAYQKTMEIAALSLIAAKAKELAKISGSDLNDALYAQAGSFNLQEMLVRQLTQGLDPDANDGIQAMFDEAGDEEKRQRQIVVDLAREEGVDFGDIVRSTVSISAIDAGGNVVESVTLNPEAINRMIDTFGSTEVDEDEFEPIAEEWKPVYDKFMAHTEEAATPSEAPKPSYANLLDDDGFGADILEELMQGMLSLFEEEGPVTAPPSGAEVTAKPILEVVKPAEETTEEKRPPTWDELRARIQEKSRKRKAA